MAKDDILKEAQEAFAECEAAERENRAAARDDIRFGRLGEQWDPGVRAKRSREGRPCLTINKLPPFIRQVVNDARQNKPSIKVMPQDSLADPATAAVLSGLIRNIEASSDADVAYDTALESAATSGVGYFRINLAYARDDNWDQEENARHMASIRTLREDAHKTRSQLAKLQGFAQALFRHIAVLEQQIIGLGAEPAVRPSLLEPV
jgi:hypothetical protein